MEAGALQAPAGLSRISIATPLLRLRSDDQLVALFRAGNEDAFQVIFDRYRQRMFAYTRQMLSGSRQDAEDALQDVFLRAYGALRANDRPVSLRAWLYRVAHNRCIDQLRRPTPAHSDVFEMSRTPLRDPLQETERREDLRRLVEDVQRLPEAQRSALLMREIDGLSYQELADALEVTVPAIKSLLVRARIGLVEAIEARDTACIDIRNDLLASFDKGVRATGKARRHLRDCTGCRAYRTELRTVQRGLGALTPPAGPVSLLAKLLGLGGAGGGAAAGGGAVLVGGGGAAAVGGGAAAATACKVAAIVCSAALVTGAAGSVENAVKRAVGPTHGASASAGSSGSASTSGQTVTLPAARAVISSTNLHRPIGTAVPTRAAVGAAAAPTVVAERRARARATPSAAVAAAAHDDVISPDGDVYADPIAPGTGTAVIERPAPATETGGAVAPEDAAETLPAPATGTPGTGPTPGTGTAAPASGAATGPSSPGATAPAATSPPPTPVPVPIPAGTATPPNAAAAGGTSAAAPTAPAAPAASPPPAG